MLIYNAITKHVYSPSNFLTLSEAVASRGWATGEFAGYRQWEKFGRIVRKNEVGVPVVMFVDKATKDGQQEKVKVLKTKRVFNIAQTEPAVPR